jgi:hypothetical protein
MPETDRVIDLAEKLLDEVSDSVVRLRLLRDVLHKLPESQEVVEARKELDHHHHVCTLAEEQWEDGSWGRLHSRDYTADQKIGTTEIGVERAIHLGLDQNHPILQKASWYLVSVLETGKCRDRPEKNNRWETGVRLFAASTLAMIDPWHPALDGVWALWVEILERTFSSGMYDEDAEAKAHRELTGASVRGSYLTLQNKYTLSLVGSRLSEFPPRLEKILIPFIWHLDKGIGYLNACVFRSPTMKPGPIDHWFASHELLSQFPTWRGLAGGTVEWLWKRCNLDGRWDFGPKSPTSVVLPLCENWRRKCARQIDWTTRVLLLLGKNY